LLDLVGVQLKAANILGSKVDIMTRRGINGHRRRFIEADAVQVF
jgi:predicted nucleotidyltransferase